MKKETKTELVALLQDQRDHGYGHLSLEVARRDPESPAGWSGRDIPEAVCTLRCTSQAGGLSGPSNLYAWEIEDGDGANNLRLHVAERIVKRLRAIERKMRRMTESEGRADSYGVFAARYMRAVGATKLVDLTREKQRQGLSNWWTMEEVPWLVNTRAKELCDELDGKTETDAA